MQTGAAISFGVEQYNQIKRNYGPWMEIEKLWYR